MQSINISQVDTIFANGSYSIEFLIYYHNKVKTKNVRSALKKLSSPFWPIFGEYRSGTIHFETYSEEEHFDEAISEENFDPADSPQEIYNNYHQTIPSDIKKLFFLKIIQYKNGTVLIPKLKHLGGDGYSYFYFLSTLAALSRNVNIPFKKSIIRRLYKPHHNRTILKNFQFNHTDLAPLRESGSLSIFMEEISKNTVHKMIVDTAAHYDQKVSTNDILSAMVVKKLAAVQKDYLGDQFYLTIPIDVRRQIKEYGARFFGNGIMFKDIKFKTNEIEQLSIEEIAIKIRESMPAVTKEIFIKFLEHLEVIIAEKQFEKLRPFDPNRGCLVTNLSKLPAHRLNFGTGNPDSIFTLTIEKNSAGILTDKDNFILRTVY